MTHGILWSYFLNEYIRGVIFISLVFVCECPQVSHIFNAGLDSSSGQTDRLLYNAIQRKTKHN